MSAAWLDGKALARELNIELKQRVEALPRPPGLAVILCGDDPASRIYVKRKGEVATRLGFKHAQHSLARETTQAELEALIDALNADETIDGVLIQLPLYAHLDGNRATQRVSPSKDVDGFSIASAGAHAVGQRGFISCTPLGVMRLLAHAGAQLSGAEAVVIGRSNIVGRPMARLLEQANATVTLCHSRTRDLAAHTRRADVIVAAVGVPELVRGDWVKPGAIVIDVGMNRLEDGRLVGDVATDEVAQVAAAITPVPGGVGPMTIAMLMENTLRAAAAHQGLVSGLD